MISTSIIITYRGWVLLEEPSKRVVYGRVRSWESSRQSEKFKRVVVEVFIVIGLVVIIAELEQGEREELRLDRGERQEKVLFDNREIDIKIDINCQNRVIVQVWFKSQCISTTY